MRILTAIVAAVLGVYLLYTVVIVFTGLALIWLLLAALGAVGTGGFDQVLAVMWTLIVFLAVGWVLWMVIQSLNPFR